jgi:hypothetical protein
MRFRGLLASVAIASLAAFAGGAAALLGGRR